MAQLTPELKIIELEPFASETAVATTVAAGASVADSRWLRVVEFLRSRELTPRTLSAYEGELRRFTDWTDKAWHQVTAREIERYKAHLKNSPSRRGGVRSPETVRRSLAAVQSFFRWLTAKDYVTKDPTLLLEMPKSKPVESKEFKPEEVGKLRIEAGGNVKLQARNLALLGVLEHGLRASEAVGLNIEDYDGERLHIREAKDNSVGTVPLTDDARRKLDHYLVWRMRQGYGIDPQAPLFISLSPRNRGQQLGYAGLYKEFKKLAALAGVDGAHPHRLRHTFATNLVLSGMDTAKARRLTRHRTETSFARYSQKALDVEAEREFLTRFGSTQDLKGKTEYELENLSGEVSQDA